MAATDRVGLVPCAFGGSELARWEAGGDLREETLRRTRLALEAAPDAQLAGILWHQGESDCGGQATGAEANADARASAEARASEVVVGYSARLTACLESLRKAVANLDRRDAANGAANDEQRSPLLLPIVMGELGYFLLELASGDARFRFAREVNDGILQTAAALRACAVVSAHGLAHVGDKLHFDRSSVEELGVRYAHAWMWLRARVDGDDVQQDVRQAAAPDPSASEQHASASSSASSCSTTLHLPLGFPKAAPEEAGTEAGAAEGPVID